MTDLEKDELLVRIISTPKGRQEIINIAKRTNSLAQLGQAIIDSLKLFK